jgi:hypothetical protein
MHIVYYLFFIFILIQEMLPFGILSDLKQDAQIIVVSFKIYIKMENSKSHYHFSKVQLVAVLSGCDECCEYVFW